MEGSLVLYRLPASGGPPIGSGRSSCSGSRRRRFTPPLLLPSLPSSHPHLPLPSTSSLLSKYPFCTSHGVASKTRCEAAVDTTDRKADSLPDLDWDNLGFGIIPTDYMYVMKCFGDGAFMKGELKKYGNIELSPSAGVLNYGQGLFEGLKAYRKDDGNILLFRPEENASRMKMGADRLCMPCPSTEQFVDAVKGIVLANRHWVPPPGKGSLYIRPLLMGSGPVLGLAPAPEYTFLIYVSPVGNYFKEGLAPINLVVESKFHRATPGGTGGIKTIGNYAPRDTRSWNHFMCAGYSFLVKDRYLQTLNAALREPSHLLDQPNLFSKQAELTIYQGHVKGSQGTSCSKNKGLL